jgi:hypothetical protein
MFECDASGGSGAVLSVSCPGGMAQQFRVQVRNAESPASWMLVGSFRQRDLASASAEELIQSGRLTRVVHCRSLPTAG